MKEIIQEILKNTQLKTKTESFISPNHGSSIGENKIITFDELGIWMS